MENLRIVREKRHKSQLAVAVAAGVSQESISTYESGTVYPRATTLIAIAKYLGTSTDYLLGLTNDDTPIRLLNKTLSDSEQTLLDMYIYLSKEDQLKLIGYAEGLSTVNN